MTAADCPALKAGQGSREFTVTLFQGPPALCISLQRLVLSHDTARNLFCFYRKLLFTEALMTQTYRFLLLHSSQAFGSSFPPFLSHLGSCSYPSLAPKAPTHFSRSSAQLCTSWGFQACRKRGAK